MLAKVESQAGPLGPDTGFVRAFFWVQMQAGKLVQQADFDAWGEAGAKPSAAGPDLKTLRLRIDNLNRQLLDGLKDARLRLDREVDKEFLQARAEAVLQGEGITADVRQLAWAPLLRR